MLFWLLCFHRTILFFQNVFQSKFSSTGVMSVLFILLCFRAVLAPLLSLHCAVSQVNPLTLWKDCPEHCFRQAFFLFSVFQKVYQSKFEGLGKIPFPSILLRIFASSSSFAFCKIIFYFKISWFCKISGWPPNKPNTCVCVCVFLS